MNYSENPITDLADCIAHAQYEGFSDIEYETRDWEEYRKTQKDVRIPARRRPTTRDFGVHAMFAQTWGSTAIGHGGMGGAAVTTAYTVVLYCMATREYLVYFGGRPCYMVRVEKVSDAQQFFVDISNQNMQSKRNAVEIYNATPFP